MSIPDIDTSIEEGYGAMIASNYDTIQECYKVTLPESLQERLEEGKNKAFEIHEGQGIVFAFGDEDFQIWSGSSQGAKWVIENDDFQIHFLSPKLPWCITVRYLSAGLWEHGIVALKERVERLIRLECIVRETEKDRWCTLSRADYAIDIYSPALTEEMKDGSVYHKAVLTSGVKKGLIGTSTCDETFTLGLNRAGVQIQLYDKGKEITEASGKAWMFAVYEKEGYFPPDDLHAKHIWRIEIRFGKDFLKDRNRRSFEKMDASLKELLAEALMRRRLIKPKSNTHRERAGLHPIWAIAYKASGSAGEYIPIGRQITLRREEYKEMLIKQYKGLARNLAMLDSNWYDHEEAQLKGSLWVAEIPLDPNHIRKVNKINEKLRFFDEAQ